MTKDIHLERIVGELKAGVSLDENFRVLVLRYQPILDRYFARRGVPPEECRDLTQETFLGIYSGIDGFRGEAPFGSWAITIAANVYRKYLRRKSADKRSARELPLENTETPGERSPAERVADTSIEGLAPEHALLSKERLSRLLEAVDSLPERMHKCLILRSFQDLSYEEIAVVMRISPETVRSNLYQARRRLKELLTALEGTAGSPEDGNG